MKRCLSALAAAVVGGGFVVMSGCVSTESEMARFVGRPSSSLVAKLGQPQLKKPDGQGGEIWAWTKANDAVIREPTQLKADVTSGNPAAMSGTTTAAQGELTSFKGETPQFRSRVQYTFYVDDKGIVYKYVHAKEYKFVGTK